MSFILQNAIQIFHDGNSIILNSRIDNVPQTYINKNVRVFINGGKRKFEGIYESFGNVIIKDLRLTYDSTLDELYNNLIWSYIIHDENDKSYFKWMFAKELPIAKIEKILEDNIEYLNPYIYNVFKFIYNERIQNYKLELKKVGY
jgi:hypothetical protein